MTFEDVIGQQETKRRLLQMIKERRLPHALLFTGPKGCGKLPMALALASFLLCRREGEPHPCGVCNDCHMTARWEHPDLHFTFPTIKAKGKDAPPVSDDYIRLWTQTLRHDVYITDEEWVKTMGAENQQAIITAAESDELLRKLSLKSSRGGYKVSLIWLPERMNGQCANKLLKIMEEPPPRTLFIMVTERPERLLETIRSRTQRVLMKSLAEDDIKRELIRRRGIDSQAAQEIARLARGSWNRAVDILAANNDNRDFLTMYTRLMRLAYRRGLKELSEWSENIAGLGRETQKQFLYYFLRMTRECFIYNFQQPNIVYLSRDEETFAKNFARFINERNILPFYDLANTAARDIGQNANARIVFYDFALWTITLLNRL